jgi:hypothetical protein
MNSLPFMEQRVSVGRDNVGGIATRCGLDGPGRIWIPLSIFSDGPLVAIDRNCEALVGSALLDIIKCYPRWQSLRSKHVRETRNVNKYDVLQLIVLWWSKMFFNLKRTVKRHGNVNNVFRMSSSTSWNENGGSDVGRAKEKKTLATTINVNKWHSFVLRVCEMRREACRPFVSLTS